MHGPNNADSSIQEKLAAVMNHTVTELIVAFLIVVSVVLVLLEAGMDPDSMYFLKVQRANDLITWVFVVELSLRFLAERRKMRFFRRFWIDIMAVLPLLRGFRVLRVLRLLRLFRVGLTVSRHLRFLSNRASFMRLEYVIITFAIFVSVLMGALSIRFAEGRVNPDFHQMDDALWFALLTLIGGEPIGGAPITEFGRVITAALMMGGLTVFAIFTGTVSAVMVDSLRSIKFRSMEIDEISNHVVICGWNGAGELVLDELMHSSKHQHFVVVAERAGLEELSAFKRNEHRMFFLHGDFTRMEVLKQAGVERAAVAILLADDSKEERTLQDRDARTVLGAMLIEKLNEGIYTTVQLHNRDNETSLRRVGVEEVIVSDEYVGNIMASAVRNRGIVSVLEELLTAKRGHQFLKSSVPPKLVGMTVGEALPILKNEHDCTLIAVDGGGGAHDVMVNPPADFVLQEGHTLVFAGSSAPNW
jgi:voltage-gated potassium channel